MWFDDSSGSGSDDEGYEDRLAFEEEMAAIDRMYGEDDGWYSGGSGDDETFDGNVENDEVPLTWVDGGSEVAAAEVESGVSPYVRLHLVGEELSYGHSTSTAGTVLLSKVWRVLPQELVEAVLLRLPASAQARFRAVCRGWLSLLASAEFLERSFSQSFSQVTRRLCAFEYSDGRYELHPHVVRAPSFKSSNVDLSFLPKVFHSKATGIHSCSPYGLMCIGRRDYERNEMHLCVLNPVNRSFKVLPMLQNLQNFDGDGKAVLITKAIPTTGRVTSFTVHLCAAIDSKKQIAVYSSKSGEWKAFEGEYSELELPEDDSEDNYLPFACNGAIYTVVRSSRPRLVRLSTEKGPRYQWDVTLPYFEKHRDLEWMKEFFLAEYRGRLLCCCDGIWMLDDARKVWVDVVDKCPPEVLPPCNPAKKHTLSLQKVQVAGDVVVFFYQLNIRRGKLGAHVDCPVAYDMLARCWHKVPVRIGKVQGLFQAIPDLETSTRTNRCT